MGLLDQMMANLHTASKPDKPASQKAPSKTAQALLQGASRSGRGTPPPTVVSEGQLLRGHVLDLRANQILVMLENGATVSARTDGTLPLSIGDNAMFLVSRTSEEQIILKLAKEGDPEANPMIDKVLNAAGITRTEKSTGIVSELLAHQQPVTAPEIRKYLSLSARYPDCPVKNLVLMKLHQIPVTEETVTRFSDYQTGSGRLTEQAATLLKQVTDAINALPDATQKEYFMQELSHILSPEATFSKDVPERNGLPSSDTAVATNDSVQTDNPVVADNASIINSSAPASEVADAATHASDDIAKNTTSENNSVPANTSASHSSLPLGDTRTSVNTEPALSDLLQTFLLSPEDIADPEKVKKYYQETETKLKQLEQLTARLAQTNGEKEISAPKQMRSNLSFMNAINQVFPYVQLPLLLRETPTQGELYVYQRKGHASSDALSALLHLELEALGTLDIFVSLAGNRVSTRFSSESKDSCALLSKELPALERTLSDKGYLLQYEVQYRESEAAENAPTLLEQFLEEYAPGGLSRYSFDIRA